MILLKVSMEKYHLIAEIRGLKLNDEKSVEKIIIELASIAEMKIIYGPKIIKGNDYNPGLTGFAIIDFSHIAVHTFTNSDEVSIDLFSCKKFDFLTVREYIINELKIKDIVFKEIIR